MNFYDELLSHIDCEPSEAILIDDSMKNISRAKSVGMRAIHYSYTKLFIEKLKKFGIEINL